MECKTVRRIYDPTSEAMSLFDEHLSGCESCRAYLSQMHRLRALLMADPPVLPPRDFDLRLQQRLEKVKRNPLQWWRFMNPRYAVSIAAMALVIVTTIIVTDHTRDLTRPGTPPPRTEVTAPPAIQLEAKAGNSAPTGPNGSERESSDVGQFPEWNVAVVRRSEMSLGRRQIDTDKMPLVASPPPQVMLRVRDETSQQERLVTIPSVVFGAEAVFASTKPTQAEMENVY